MKIGAIILAGGKSSRMGEDKGLMLLDGKPMIQHMIDAVNTITDAVIIVANNEAYSRFGVPVFKDEIKDKGPLAGIYTGLKHSKAEKNIIVSCDTPYITQDLLQFLLNQSIGFDITIPQKEGRTHQLIGVFDKKCGNSFKVNIDNDRLKLITAYERLNLSIVDANHFDEHLFTNINSKDDFNR